jgi:hypothetical protein
MGVPGSSLLRESIDGCPRLFHRHGLWCAGSCGACSNVRVSVFFTLVGRFCDGVHNFLDDSVRFIYTPFGGSQEYNVTF